LNFSLLVITASDKLRYYTGIPRTWVLIVVAIPVAFTGMWLLGYFLDNVVKYGQAYNLEASKRNPTWDEQKMIMGRLEEKLEAIAKKVGA